MSTSSKRSVLIILLMSLTLFSSSVTASSSPVDEAKRTECGHTMYPELCVETLAATASGKNQLDFISTLLRKAIYETSLPPFFFNNSVGASDMASAAGDWCQELMELSLARLTQALEAVESSPEHYKSDIQTWLSAAITYHETCRDETQKHGLSDPEMAKIFQKMQYLSQLVSNPLAMVNKNIAGVSPGNRSPVSRRAHDERFPAWVTPANRKLLQGTAAVSADAVVAKDGTGDYKTVTEAINAARGGRFVIYVKAGVYNEKVMCRKDGITLIGDGKYSTIIAGGGSVGGGTSLRGSSTFTIIGDGFIAKDIGFQNTAGPQEHQAIALTVISDRSVFYRCSISGFQDSLYAHSLRQFYRECDIHGTIDFIFGNAAAVFQSCNLLLRRPRSGGAYNTILANGRSDPGQNTGFSVQSCSITAGSDLASVKGSYKSYLGRPWKPYSRSVIMKTNIDGAISSRGWVEWEGASSSIYRTLYYAEYGNTGPSGSTAGRVNWPGFHVIGLPEASKFTVASFIYGTSWLPSTGVTFLAGL